MKLFACCVALLAVFSLARCQTSSEELMNVKVKMLKNYIREKQAIDSLTAKVEAVCPGYGSKFEAALVKVERCTDDINEESETVCSSVKNHFEKCSQPFVKLFEECLPEKSKDIPSFLIKSILSASDYLCKTDGEHIFELSNTCVKNQNYRTQRCVRKIQSKLQQYSSKMPSKEDICEFSASFKGCLESHLQSNCGHPKTREAFLSLYDALRSPCQSHLNEIEVMEPVREWVSEV